MERKKTKKFKICFGFHIPVSVRSHHKYSWTTLYLLISDLRSRHPQSRESTDRFVPEKCLHKRVRWEPGKEEPRAADSCSQTAELQSDHCSQQVPGSLSATSGWLWALSLLGSYWPDLTLRLYIVLKKCITGSERGHGAGEWDSVSVFWLESSHSVFWLIILNSNRISILAGADLCQQIF